MKNNITSQLRSVNPIERFRDKQGLSQKDFAVQLGYGGAGVYRHHCKTFSRDILCRISDVYGTDLRDEAICHLRAQIKATGHVPDRGIRSKADADHGDSYAEMVG